MFRIVDLFAGMGGMRIGLEQALDEKGIPHTCVLTSEIKPSALKVYEDNFGKTDFYDITKIDEKSMPDFDMAVFGNPCQSFSEAGKRLGFDDTRGLLFFDVIRILKEKKPMFFLMENVSNLVIHERTPKEKKEGVETGKTFRTMLKTFEEIGYHTSWALLRASDYGVPQIRERVYVLGCRDSKISMEDFPMSFKSFGEIQEHGMPVSDTKFSKLLFEYLYKNNLPVEYLYDKSIRDKRGGGNNIHGWDLGLRGTVTKEEKALLDRLVLARRNRGLAEAKGLPFKDGGVGLTKDELKSLNCVENVDDSIDKLLKMGYIKIRDADKYTEDLYDLNGGKLSYEFAKILDPSKPCLTLVATEADRIGVIDGNGIRRLTLREGLRINGFPEEYRLDVPYRKGMDLLGNSVAVPVIKMICERVVLKYESLCSIGNDG